MTAYGTCRHDPAMARCIQNSAWYMQHKELVTAESPRSWRRLASPTTQVDEKPPVGRHPPRSGHPLLVDANQASCVDYPRNREKVVPG
jgi:hypothetical protein